MQELRITFFSLDSAFGVRASDLFARHQRAIFQATDRLFGGLLIFQWFAAIAAALWISPLTWEGLDNATRFHVWAPIFLGGITISLPVAMVLWRPGAAVTRHLVDLGQMLMGSLLIHLFDGRLETHFHVFGSQGNHLHY